jgi:ribokinase
MPPLPQAAQAAGVPVFLDAGGIEAPLSRELLQHITVLSPNETELARLSGLPTDTLEQVQAAAAALQVSRELAGLSRGDLDCRAPLGVVCRRMGRRLSACGTSSGRPATQGRRRAQHWRAPCAAQHGFPCLAWLQAQGVDQVLVKLGSDGSLLVPGQGQAPVRQPVIAAPQVVDTTGAGDCFTAAYAVGVLEGRPPQQAMQFASAAASICVRRPGAMPSLPGRDEVDALLQGM